MGFHQYTYPIGKEPNVILNLAHGITSRVDSLTLEVVNNTTLTGFRHANSSLEGDKTVWFVIKFSKPFIDYGIEVQGKLVGKQQKTGGKDIKAFSRFNALPQNRIQVKVALSRVDKQGVLNNLERTSGLEF